MVQPHPKPRLRDELRERPGTCESLGPDALDAELLHYAFGPESASVEDLPHAATAERAPERVAAEPGVRAAWYASRLRFVGHLVAVCLAAGLTPRVRADDRPRLIVVRERIAGADAPAGLAPELAAALSARGMRAREVPAPSVPEDLDERATLARAEQAYTALRPVDARETLDALLARADSRGDAGLDAAGYARALLLLSLSAQALGDDAAADAALDRLLAVDPAVMADAATYPPPLRERLERRRAVRATLPLVALRVSSAAGAAIEIDGRDLPPGEVQCNVVAGPHLVRVRASGYVSAGQRVDVGTEATSVALELALDAGALLAAPGPADAPVGALLRELARTLDVSLLIVDVHRGHAGISVDVRDEASSRRPHLELPRGASARSMAVRIAAALLPPRASLPLEPRASGPVIWPWLVAAGVAVAGAIVVGVAVTTRDEPAGFVLVPVSP